MGENVRRADRDGNDAELGIVFLCVCFEVEDLKEKELECVSPCDCDDGMESVDLRLKSLEIVNPLPLVSVEVSIGCCRNVKEEDISKQKRKKDSYRYI